MYNMRVYCIKLRILLTGNNSSMLGLYSGSIQSSVSLQLTMYILLVFSEIILLLFSLGQYPV